ncbi:hypothetical protein O2W17_05255 [Blastococcus sp. VKM Ac-2987]|nr:hypothetical protein [Blastococcus sp. VKM Ac-2987]MCZ2857946.1 hypothetical protein [Blastococcus sp. VKM Ac-2987]
MAGARVEPQLDRLAAVEAGLVEQRVGRVDVQLAVLADTLAVAVDDGGDVGVGGRAATGEDGVGDGLPVDAHRQRLTDARVGEPLVVGRVAEVGEPGGRGLEVAVAEHVLGRGQGVRRQVRQDVEVARLQVVVSGVQVGVDAEVHGLRDGRVLAGVVLVPGDGDALTGDELALGLERTVADRHGAEALGVLEEGLGHRPEGVVADGHRELGERRGELHLEGVLVDDPEAAELLGGGVTGDVALVVGRRLQVVVPEDVREEVGRTLGVGAVGGVVPRVDEGLRGHRSAVVERPAVLELDGPGGVVLGLDRLRDAGVLDRAVGGVLDQARPQGGDDLVALALRRVARDEGVLRLTDVDAEGAAVGSSAVATAAAVVVTATTGGQQHRGGDAAGHERGPALAQIHVQCLPRPAPAGGTDRSNHGRAGEWTTDWSRTEHNREMTSQR